MCWTAKQASETWCHRAAIWSGDAEGERKQDHQHQAVTQQPYSCLEGLPTDCAES